MSQTPCTQVTKVLTASEPSPQLLQDARPPSSFQCIPSPAVHSSSIRLHGPQSPAKRNKLSLHEPHLTIRRRPTCCDGKNASVPSPRILHDALSPTSSKCISGSDHSASNRPHDPQLPAKEPKFSLYDPHLTVPRRMTFYDSKLQMHKLFLPDQENVPFKCHFCEPLYYNKDLYQPFLLDALNMRRSMIRTQKKFFGKFMYHYQYAGFVLSI